MKRRISRLALMAFLTMTSQAVAEQWVSLGWGSSRAQTELDLDSVARSSDGNRAIIRVVIPQPQGTLTSYFDMGIFCPERFVTILGGEIHSSWSSKIVPMPEMSMEERSSSIPSQNPAFQNLFDYLCVN